MVLATLLFSLAIGSTIACGLFNYGDGANVAIKVAAYFWMLSAILAWWRTTVYLIEEAFGPDHWMTKLFPIFRTPLERKAPYVIPGLGEPGVKRGVPKMLAVNRITEEHEVSNDAAGNGPNNGKQFDPERT